MKYLSLSVAIFYQHVFQFRKKIIHILEFPVHGCEPHIRNVIYLMQPGHDLLPDHGRGDLLFPGFPEIAIQLIQKILNHIHADLPFFTGPLNAGSHLLTGKEFPTPVLFDEHDGNFLNPFIGGETPATRDALPTPANGVSGLVQPGINDFVINFTAKRTFHKSLSYSSTANEREWTLIIKKCSQII